MSNKRQRTSNATTNSVLENNTSSRSDEIDANGEDISNDILESFVVSDTKEQYRRSIVFISNFCKSAVPGSCTADGQLILPVDITCIKTFFGEMARPKANGSVRAISTITGYASALKFAYKEKGLVMSDELKGYLSRFHQGYKRVVSYL